MSHRDISSDLEGITSHFQRTVSHLDVQQKLSNPKPGHTTGASRRGGARRDGGAARDRAGRDADKSSRGPISIFGPIFEVEDRSENPDLRIAERSWWP